jgi:hypothetical protein
MGRTQVFDWFRRFKEGRTFTESDPRSGSKTKAMLLVFFDIEGNVRREYAPEGQTVNKEFHLEVLRRLRESDRRKLSEMWRDDDWIPHHNYAPAHTSQLMQQFLAKHGTAQPPYSLDLAPCDIFLFPRLKKLMKGHRFEATEEIKRNSTKTLLYIPKE